MRNILPRDSGRDVFRIYKLPGDNYKANDIYDNRNVAMSKWYTCNILFGACNLILAHFLDNYFRPKEL